MSYQQVRTTGNVHRLNEYIPTYQPHSDYLPTNRVVDANQPEAQRWVLIDLFSYLITSNKKELERSILNAQLNSILPVMFQCVLSKMWLSMHPSQRPSSTAELKEYDLNAIINSITYNHLNPLSFFFYKVYISRKFFVQILI